jgi:hydrogenase nickel incorporation protein HypA/HybF
VHELSLAYNVVEIVIGALPKDRAFRVRSVRLRVGSLAAVVPEALNFAYDVATEGTALEGSTLQVAVVPAAIHCPRCDRVVELPNAHLFCCPICDTPCADIRQGQELEVESFELEEDGEAPPGGQA